MRPTRQSWKVRQDKLALQLIFGHPFASQFSVLCPGFAAGKGSYCLQALPGAKDQC